MFEEVQIRTYIGFATYIELQNADYFSYIELY